MLNIEALSKELADVVNNPDADVVRAQCAVEVLWRCLLDKREEPCNYNEHNIPHVLACLLTKYVYYPDVVQEVLHTASILANDKDTQLYALFQPLANTFTHYASVAGIIVSAARFVFYLTLDNSVNRTMLGNHGFVSKIVAAIPFNWNNDLALTWSCWALTSMCKDNEHNKAQAVQQDGGVVLRLCFKNTCPDLMYACVTLIMHLSSLNVTAQNKYAPCIPAISRTMQSTKGNNNSCLTERNCARALINIVYQNPSNVEYLLRFENGSKLLQVFNKTGWKPWVVGGFASIMENFNARLHLLHNGILTDINRELANGDYTEQATLQLLRCMTSNLNTPRLPEYANLLSDTLLQTSADVQQVTVHTLWRVSEVYTGVPINNLLQIIPNSGTTFQTYACMILANSTHSNNNPIVGKVVFPLTKQDVEDLRVKAFMAAIVSGAPPQYFPHVLAYWKAVHHLAKTHRVSAILERHLPTLLETMCRESVVFHTINELVKNGVGEAIVTSTCTRILEHEQNNRVLRVQCLKLLATTRRPPVVDTYLRLNNVLDCCPKTDTETTAWVNSARANWC